MDIQSLFMNVQIIFHLDCKFYKNCTQIKCQQDRSRKRETIREWSFTE